MIDVLLSAAVGGAVGAVGAGAWRIWDAWCACQRDIAAMDAARYRAHLTNARALLREAADVIDDLTATSGHDAAAEHLMRRVADLLATTSTAEGPRP